MKTLIYQLMKHPQLVSQIKNGTFVFPEKINEEEKRVIVKAVKNENTGTESFDLWIHG
ncbi:hypothetical protein [Sporolactobacillus putidus]|uniref:Uncharacterized protein n=1 Tax=Sporolactobacillus putidus TaxID=492735 RepID=A0A917VYD9_9BACL|nr:hypothetical protein [Sporolactobacillus putidus]GGL44481.1 hypothetical protein GCM10007968_05660 [Sporolactobacillus putidus]